VQTVIVNEIEVEVGAKDNLVQAAQRAGVEVPHYCWHHDLSVVASCRMCLVEVGERKPDGSTVMQPRLVPACQTLARPNTVVVTNSPKVKNAQAQTLEYLLLNHPLDCSICDQAGECYLQDYTHKFGRAHSRLNEPKVQREDKYHIGEQIALFTDRCVMCTRCVRFTREISGTSELQVTSRGSIEEIDTFPGQPCNNKLAGNVVDLCPVGALCSKDFLYKQRVWWLKSQDSVCVGCSTGCSIKVDQNEDRIYRLRPRENPQAQGSFMCDDGRFGWKYSHSERRLTKPRIGKLSDSVTIAKPSFEQGSERQALISDETAFAEAARRNSQLTFIDPWPTVLKATRDALTAAVAQNADSFIGVLSPMMTCEEAFVLAKFLRSIHRRATLAMGPVPVVGEDDRYPKDYQGLAPPVEQTKFTIRAEKCPNRYGVEQVLRHFQGEVIPFSSVIERLRQGKTNSAFLVGGYPDTWIDAEYLPLFQSLHWLIVQDFLQSPLSDLASILLPAATFAEREGTVVNHAGLAQLIRPVVRPPGDARADGRILSELAQRTGLFNAAAIRREMAHDVPAFNEFARGEVGELGIFLKQPQLIQA
jgi:NADH-quinone oxidoreductase subunit G